MKQGWKHSSESKQCVKCRRVTSHYKTYEESGIEVVLPLCDEHFDSVEAAATAQLSIRAIKKEILKQLSMDGESVE